MANEPIDTSKLGPIKLDYSAEVIPEGCTQVGWLVWDNAAPVHKRLVSLDEGLTFEFIRIGWRQRPVYVRK